MARRYCDVIVAMAAVLVALVNGPAVHAETRALLVGVWQFGSPQIADLDGPPNDLDAMEKLARAQGASDITVLRNTAVSRTTMENALHALGLRAKPGDWILFYYSGHGAQAEAAIKGTADGDLDQFIPLSGFDLDKQDPERFVVDKDFYTWLARYIPRDVKVLMIADTCHSGTMHRSVDPRAWRFTSRLAFRGDGTDIKLAGRPAPRFPSVLAGADISSVNRADLPNLVFIGAALDDQLALEASLPNESGPARGLLTYAFEQALTERGPDGKTLAGDLDGDGKVSVAEIGSYVNTQVRALTGQRQETTAFYPSEEAKLPLFATIMPPVSPAPANGPAKGPQLPALFAMNSQTGALLNAARPAPAVKPWRIAGAMADADFGWDSAAGTVLRRSGDAVAENVKSVAALRGVIEKWNAVERLRPFLSEARARIVIGPAQNGTRYAASAKVTLSVERQAESAPAPLYMTIVNLASDGTVQTLYPLTDDGDGLLPPQATLPVLDNRVVPPFGTDHVIALATPDKPVALRALLRTAENQRAAGRLVEPIQAALAKAAGRGALSIGELYTGQ